MPSCDGSNCGACSACATEIKTEYVYLDDKERKAYEERIRKLETELKHQKGINEKLVERLLDAVPQKNEKSRDLDSLASKMDDAKQGIRAPQKSQKKKKKDKEQSL